MYKQRAPIVFFLIIIGLVLVISFIPTRVRVGRFHFLSPSLAYLFYERVQTILNRSRETQQINQQGIGICGPEGCGMTINREPVSLILSANEASQLAEKLKPPFVPLTNISIAFTQGKVTAQAFSFIPGYLGKLVVSGPIIANRWQLETGSVGGRAITPEDLSKLNGWFTSLQNRFLESQKSELYSAVIQADALSLSGKAPKEYIRIEPDGTITLNLAPW